MVKVEYVKIDSTTEIVKSKSCVFDAELIDICDEDVRNWTRTALDNAPDTFWVEPASKSGRYHPVDECRAGGKILHTKRAFCVMKILVDSEADRLGEHFSSFCLSAILLHDVCSNSKTHPDDVYPWYLEKLGFEFVTKYPIIMTMIKTHMGRWGRQRPRTMEECLVHYADNIASKLHTMRPEVPYDLPGCVRKKGG